MVEPLLLLVVAAAMGAAVLVGAVALQQFLAFLDEGLFVPIGVFNTTHELIIMKGLAPLR